MRACAPTVIGRKLVTRSRIRFHGRWCWPSDWITSSSRWIDQKILMRRVTSRTRPRHAAKASITAEAGHAGTVETDDLNALINGCLNVMRYLKMLPGPPQTIEHPVWIENVVTIERD